MNTLQNPDDIYTTILDFLNKVSQYGGRVDSLTVDKTTYMRLVRLATERASRTSNTTDKIMYPVVITIWSALGETLIKEARDEQKFGV